MSQSQCHFIKRQMFAEKWPYGDKVVNKNAGEFPHNSRTVPRYVEYFWFHFIFCCDVIFYRFRSLRWRKMILFSWKFRVHSRRCRIYWIECYRFTSNANTNNSLSGELRMTAFVYTRRRCVCVSAVRLCLQIGWIVYAATYVYLGRDRIHMIHFECKHNCLLQEILFLVRMFSVLFRRY